MLGTGAENNVHDINAKNHSGGLGTQTSADKRNTYIFHCYSVSRLNFKNCIVTVVINTVFAKYIFISWWSSNRK